MQAKLLTISIALGQLSQRCYHYFAKNNTAPAYIVWAEESQIQLSGDNTAAELGWSGTTDVFSKTEFDPLFDSVPAALRAIGASVELLSVQYEPETGLIHYEWAWSYA